MNKLKLLLEIIKHSTKAKIIACSAGAGVIAIGGGIAYGIATNNNATVADNKNGSEIVTTYNETEKEEVKDKDKDKDKEVVKEETKDESKPVVNEEVKKDDTSTSTTTSSSNEKPSTTTSDTKTNVETKTEPQVETPQSKPQVETPQSKPQVETPPSYKAAGIDWELTERANQLRVSIYSDYKGTRGDEIKEITKNVCLYNSAIPQWLIDGINDPVIGEVKYVETRIGKYTITDVKDLRTGVVQTYNQTLNAHDKDCCYYMKVENDGQGNLIVTCVNVVTGINVI